MPHDTPASAWVQRWAHLLAPQGAVLDVACGQGRHMRFFSERNHAVTGVDIAPSAIETAAQWGCVVQADLENAAWPLPGQQFAGVIVTNYLWRPLLPAILASLAPGGVLLYETFAQGHEQWGRPSRADFLLRPGELLQACAALHIAAYEHGYEAQPPRLVQRIAAIHPLTGKPCMPALAG